MGPVSTPEPSLSWFVGGAALALLASACAPAETAAEEPPGDTGSHREVQFTVGEDEVYGTFSLPEEGADGVPGALVISGSGPTDRDGNSDMRPAADTNLNFAHALADAGVATLRYDKLGSGETGTGDRDPEDPVDPEIFDEQAAAAYEHLLEQPEVDPERTLVLGHSEGALYALRMHELVPGSSPAVVLAAPPGERYLDVVDRQLTEQVRTAEAMGGLGEVEARTVLSDARAARAAVRADRPMPEEMDPALGGLYGAGNRDTLAFLDELVPAELAAGLPEGTESLVLWGEQDAQISREEIDELMTGFEDGPGEGGGVERVDLPETDHVFREQSDDDTMPAVDEDRRFSPDVAPALESFVDRAW
ncbi:alpha/beta hydrolase [Nocardiopsis sp. HNM0947]|uniref:Alpha/beta hydrolase n=1 Tax=Nocardiopsis coralli TaxID=2772213 RepID=A0ABR9P3Z2_9ACTN|nr:alpha/beta hydrolase [Nocardiopsis coralli]MBE2998559.1 alpha/beta hydrolase [Nocardiopsis coralli]